MATTIALLALLHAPLISQQFPQGRTPAYHGERRCGPATMAMVAREYRRRPRLSDAELIRSLDRLDDGLENQATSPEGILRMAAALRLRAQVHSGFDGEWLRRSLQRGRMVVALGRPRFLPPSQAHTGGHFVGVVGVTPKGEFIVNDPYRRKGRGGARYRVPEKTLAAFISHKPNGTLFALYPAKTEGSRPSPERRTPATPAPSAGKRRG